MLLAIPNVVGFISGLFPMIVWLWWNDLFGSFFEWVIINSAHTLSTIDLSSGYYLHGGGILLPLTLIGGVLLLLNPSQQGNERFAARTLVAGTALAWLVRFLHPNQLLYNLQAFAIPGAILAAIALIRLFSAVRWRRCFIVIAASALFFILYRPIVYEGIQLKGAGIIINRDELQTLIQKTRSDEATCVGFAPYHPLFCRDATKLYLVWDLRFARGHKISETGSQPYKKMWIEAISEITLHRPDIIVAPEYFEKAFRDNILSEAQIEQFRQFTDDNYMREREGAISYLIRR